MKSRALGSSLLRAFLTERILGYLTRGLVDVPMLAMLVVDSSISGIARMLAVMVPVNFVLCAVVVIGSDILYKRGVDITGLEGLREFEADVSAQSQWYKKLIRRMLRSPTLIFWIGSWFYLDPDYVTLLLRKKGEGGARVFLRLTLPSVLLAMTVWTPIFWAAAQGFKWAVWLVK